jgi:hypothetical protein
LAQICQINNVYMGTMTGLLFHSYVIWYVFFLHLGLRHLLTDTIGSYPLRWCSSCLLWRRSSGRSKRMLHEGLCAQVEGCIYACVVLVNMFWELAWRLHTGTWVETAVLAKSIFVYLRVCEVCLLYNRFVLPNYQGNSCTPR